MKKNFLVFFMFLIFVLGCKKESPVVINENVNPTVDLVSPLSLENYRIGDTIFVSVLANDIDDSVKSIFFYKSSQLFAVDSIAPWEVGLMCSQAHQVTISVMAIDYRDGLSSKKHVTVNIVENLKPDVWVSKDTYPVVENDNVEFSVYSHSPNSKIVKVDFYINDYLYGSDTLGHSEFIVDSIALGDYKVYAIVEDQEGETQKSEDIFFSVKENQAPTFEFSLYSYSGYFPGQPISISVLANDEDGSIDSLFVFVDDSLFYRDDDHNPSGIYYTPPNGGEYRFNVIAYDNKGLIGYSDTIIAHVKPAYTMDGLIVDITSSNYNDLVFALDQTNSKLLLINPITTEWEEISLPYSQPLKFYYSMTDEKLYIVYAHNASISIWDYNTQTMSEISFSDGEDALDIEVDDINRRIYVLATNGLNIIDQDNGNLLSTTSLYNVYDIAIHSNNRWLIASSRGSGISVNKYDVANDNLVLIQTKTFSGSYKNQIKINHTNNYFIIPGMGGTKTNLAIDIDNLDNIVGEFSYDEWYNYSAFSMDDNLLFVAIDNYDNNQLNIMDARNFYIVDVIDVPNSDMAIMCSSFSQDKLVVFTFDHFYGDELGLFFFDL